MLDEGDEIQRRARLSFPRSFSWLLYLRSPPMMIADRARKLSLPSELIAPESRREERTVALLVIYRTYSSAYRDIVPRANQIIFNKIIISIYTAGSYDQTLTGEYNGAVRNIEFDYSFLISVSAQTTFTAEGKEDGVLPSQSAAASSETLVKIQGASARRETMYREQ